MGHVHFLLGKMGLDEMGLDEMALTRFIYTHTYLCTSFHCSSVNSLRTHSTLVLHEQTRIVQPDSFRQQ